MKNKFLFFLLFLFSLSVVLLILRGQEDTWICEKGQWIKHGHPNYPQPAVQCGKKTILPKNKIDCEKVGGVWKKLGPDPFETCNIKAKDRGNICYDSSECEGSCQAELTREELTAGMRGKSWKRYGVCSVWLVELGCRGIVRNGIASVICMD